MSSDLSRFERLGENATRALANRFPRRSLFGQLGRGGILMAMAGGTAVALDSPARAHVSNPCAESLSVTCFVLTGTNDCPSGTCGCGWWKVCGGPTPCTHAKVWSDCCSEGSACGGSNQRCVGGAPSCYNHKQYPQGCGSGSAHIKCRRWYCSTC